MSGVRPRRAFVHLQPISLALAMSQASWRRLLVATAVAAAAAVGVGAFVALQRKHAGKGQEAKDEPAEALIERHPEGVADRSEEVGLLLHGDICQMRRLNTH